MLHECLFCLPEAVPDPERDPVDSPCISQPMGLPAGCWQPVGTGTSRCCPAGHRRAGGGPHVEDAQLRRAVRYLCRALGLRWLGS